MSNTVNTTASTTVAPARHRLEQGASRLDSITLDEVLADSGLQTRVDRKYFVPLDALETLFLDLAGSLRPLEIEGRRMFSYRSVYFDTAELAFFHQHLQARRRRFKVRTRSYLDSGMCMLEVKSKGFRAQTIKDRFAYGREHAESITADGLQFISGVMGAALPGEHLRPSLETLYRRMTLVDDSTGSRITCDVDIRYSADDRGHSGRADEVLLETKSAGGPGLADRWLREHRIRPHAVSKYCVGIALLYPHVRSNPWTRTLRRHF